MVRDLQSSDKPYCTTHMIKMHTHALMIKIHTHAHMIKIHTHALIPVNQHGQQYSVTRH